MEHAGCRTDLTKGAVWSDARDSSAGVHSGAADAEWGVTRKTGVLTQ